MNSRTLVVLLALGVIGLLAVLPSRKTEEPRRVAVTAVTAAAADVPRRPEEITFDPLSFEPPDAAGFRRVLADGTVVYLAPSHEFPLVTVAMTFKGGASLDPLEIPGLASMTARMVCEGGSKQAGPAELDETLDFLATEVSVAAGDTFTSATMNSLTSKIGRAHV